MDEQNQKQVMAKNTTLAATEWIETKVKLRKAFPVLADHDFSLVDGREEAMAIVSLKLGMSKTELEELLLRL